jgi:hypothetical protein
MMKGIAFQKLPLQTAGQPHNTSAVLGTYPMKRFAGFSPISNRKPANPLYNLKFYAGRWREGLAARLRAGSLRLARF